MRGIRRLAAFACVPVLLLARASAQSAPPAAVAEPLERALSSVSSERLLADIAYVSCDEMGGRATPSTGQRLTARFLRNRLQRIGWKPGAKDGWFHEYQLDFKRIKEPDTRVVVTRGGSDGTGGEPLPLEFAQDYAFYTSELATLDTSGGVVFCGNATNEELAALPALKGKWALHHDPGEGSRALSETLGAAGAIGMILFEGPQGPAGGRSRTKADFADWLAAMREGFVSRQRSRGPSLPRLFFTKEAVARVLEFAGVAEPKVGDELPIQIEDHRAIAGDGKVTCENVCGFWPGSDPELAKETILVTAHYDHLGTASDGRVYNGADDNGSGTCGLLALAEALAAQGPLRRSVALIWVSGEEIGLLGSRAWTQTPWLPDGAQAVADLNLDMIGRNAPDQIFVTPSREHAAYNFLTKIVERCAPLEGFARVDSADRYYTRSDHVNFAKMGLPVAFLFADVHPDYHEVTDDVEKIDGAKTARVVRLVLRMLGELQHEKLDMGGQ